MSRKLAYIATVTDIQPIPNKDRIELALINQGWNVIVAKSEYNVGDKTVYVEIDSVLPDKPEFEAIRKRSPRIKTMKMAGCISQGICFPLSILPKGDYADGQDVTDIIGITQYEPDMDLDPVQDESPKRKYPRWLMRYKWFRKLVSGKKQSKEFPGFIKRTDETRVQNKAFILNDKDTKWIKTEKLDGQSITCFIRVNKKRGLLDRLLNRNKYEFGVCSRNLRLWKEDDSTYWRVARRYNIEQILTTWIESGLMGDNDFIAIQGEVLAPGVQKNRYKVDEPDLYVFNIIEPAGRWATSAADFLCYEYGLKHVPILEEDVVLPDTVQEMLDMAHGKSQLYDTLREGLVFRSSDGEHSFKVIDPKWLLKND